ncbi:MAG: DUF5010 domain-containing protein [Paludibacter sp.]|nr:DUF5010 domain-containing protein [Paludibacter sp.]
MYYKYKTFLFLLVSLLILSINSFSQEIGATFCWHSNEIYGGHSYAYNQSIVKKGLPTDNTHWSANTEWWENMVEEVEYSGMDYIALLIRGDQPNAPDRGNGNPKHIPKLVNAMNIRGINSYKLAIFDDCPNSWTGSKNWDVTGGGNYSTSSPKFDCGDIDNYKYIWDYNLKLAIQNIPDERRYKINGRMVIIFWSVKSSWMSNFGNGNLKKIIEHIRTQCQATFGFNPYLIVQQNWLVADSQCNSPLVVDAVHNWFSSAGNTSWTNYLWNGLKTGVVAPGFGEPESPPFIDPKKGQTLINGLNGTVNDGASLTLLEGFTDAAESAAYWRSKDVTYYEYPNQRLNIVRRYTKKAFANSLKMEAEGCDYYSDITTGNSGGAFRDGNLDIVKTTDINGGWNVTNTQAGEWMEWKELPLLKDTKFQLRYKSTNSASVSFSVDGTTLSTIILPPTSGVWSTIDAGIFNNANNGLHTVRLTIVSGSPDINYFLRTDGNSLSGINDLKFSDDEITVYPNPAKDYLNIKLNHNVNRLELSLYDISGKIQLNKTISKDDFDKMRLNISHLNQGIYLLKITSDKQTITKKINIVR